MEFFERYFHIPLPIVTKHELGLPFPPRNLPIKFGTNPFIIFLVIFVTDRQARKPTPVKTYSLAFAGIIKLENIGSRIDMQMQRRQQQQVAQQRIGMRNTGHGH